MKRIFRKISIVVLIFVVWINDSLITFGMEESSNSEMERIQSFVDELGYNINIIERVALYDEKDQVDGWLYYTESGGFVITDENDHIVEANKDLEFDYEQKIYYAGYGEYYNKTFENIYSNIVSGEIIDESAFEYRISEYNEIKRKLVSNQVVTPYVITGSGYLSGIPSCFTSAGTNVADTGVCGYVSAAVFLDYYNRYIYSGLIPNAYNNSVTLINTLYSYGDGGNGMSQANLVHIINSFLDETGNNYPIYMTAITSNLYSRYTYLINRNRPVIVTLANHYTYGNHMVVGYGYFTETTNGYSSNFIVVNDSLGNNSVTISVAYMQNITYSAD